MTEKQKRNYAAIDLWKFLMAFIIIFIHCDVLLMAKSKEAAMYVKLLRDVAISSFFCANGFFGIGGRDFRNSDSDWKIFWARWRNNVCRYIKWNIIYLPLMLFGEFAVYHSDIRKAVLKIARAFFVTGWHFYTWHLWYLLAMIGAMAVIAVMLRKGMNLKSVLLVAAFLFLAGAVLDDWEDVAGAPKFVVYYFQFFYNTRNAAFYGMVFIAYGARARERRAEKEPDMRMIWMLLAAAFAGMYFCRNIPVVPVLFDGMICCLVFEIVLGISLPERPLWKLLRGMSTNMYFIHMYFVALFYLILRRDVVQPDFITILGASACTFFTALVLEFWKKKKSGRWLRHFF